MSARGGRCLPSLSRGKCLPSLSWGGRGGVCPLWTEFLTHASENITFPQLHLRTAMISNIETTLTINFHVIFINEHSLKSCEILLSLEICTMLGANQEFPEHF